MIDDSAYRNKGKFIKGHPGYNKPQNNPDQPADDPPTDFDTAILEAAASFGTAKKPKTGLAGYCASLRDSRPTEFAALITKALARKQVSTAAAAIGITSVEFTVAQAGTFLSDDQARAEWGRRTGFKLSDTPQLVVDNDDDPDDPDDDDDPDEAA